MIQNKLFGENMKNILSNREKAPIEDEENPDYTDEGKGLSISEDDEELQEIGEGEDASKQNRRRRLNLIRELSKSNPAQNILRQKKERDKQVEQEAENISPEELEQIEKGLSGASVPSEISEEVSEEVVPETTPEVASEVAQVPEEPMTEEEDREIQELLSQVLDVSPESSSDEVADEEEFAKLKGITEPEEIAEEDEEEKVGGGKKYEFNDLMGGLNISDIITITPEKFKEKSEEPKSEDLTRSMRELAKDKIKLFHRLIRMRAGISQKELKEDTSTRIIGLKEDFKSDMDSIDNADYYEARWVLKFLQGKEKELKRKLLMRKRNEQEQKASEQLLKDINEFNTKAKGQDFSGEGSAPVKVYSPEEIAKYEESLKNKEKEPVE